MSILNKQTKIIFGGALIAAVVGGSIFFLSRQPHAQETAITETKILVQTSAPFNGNIVIEGEYIGTAAPEQQIIVFPKVVGEVTTANFNVGDSVKEGDVLCELENKSLEYSVSQMQASIYSAQSKANLNLEVAQKNLETFQDNLEDNVNSTIISAEAAVAVAQNKVEAASTDLRSAKRIYQDAKDGDSIYTYNDDEIDKLRDAVNQKQIVLEGAYTGLEQAEDSLRAAKTAVNNQKTTSTNAIKQAELNTNLNDQYIALKKLKEDLGNTVITAPISGTIEQKNVETFDIVNLQTPVYIIANKDHTAVTFKVAESALESMSIGDTVTIEKNDELFNAEITEISSIAEPTSGLFVVKATIKFAGFDIYNGSKVKVIAVSQKATNSLLVPIDAVYYENGITHVFTLKDDIIHKKTVITGIFDEKNIQINFGLTTSDVIVTSWNSNLKDGIEASSAN